MNLALFLPLSCFVNRLMIEGHHDRVCGNMLKLKQWMNDKASKNRAIRLLEIHISLKTPWCAQIDTIKDVRCQ